MNGAFPPTTAETRARGGDLGPAGRSWWIRQEMEESGALPPGPHPASSAGTSGPGLDSRRWVVRPLVDAFTEAWEQGRVPVVEDYLDRLGPADSLDAVELIYREYCLAEADGHRPDPSSYLARFPRHRESLERLLQLHGACSSSMLGRWIAPEPAGAGLPEAGDSIGPYLLCRELGRGSFARVFLAEQADLEDRLVVVKVSTQVTREPWLLARARHTHIVEIMSHTLVDDGAFQLICMPFFGGATLAAVLAARRGQARPAASGRDLLADLDVVAAPEYPGAHAARPAREVLARLSYDRAIAWIVARLAEALDHAFNRDVAHGDVKPSNILLSADGNPMLLDFNLARDGAPARDGSSRDVDPGGTLAYMAPERLRVLAGDELPHDTMNEPVADPDPAGIERAPHLADIYALGIVLLEALTGRPPLTMKIPAAQGRSARRLHLRSAAGIYAAARLRSARSIVRDSELAGGRPIAPGLRAILQRCLDPDPAERYRRASELADDLDRWRTDRPLAFTDEPFWGQTIPRWLRRHRRTLTVAAVCLLTVGLLTRVVLLNGSTLTLYQNAMGKLAQLWDNPGVPTYRYQPAQMLRLLKPDEPWVVESARHVLEDYGILGPGDVLGAGDWRQRDDVRRLPAADREDLELWIMERGYRYCRALDDRPKAPGDWQQALKLLDRVVGPRRTPAFTPMRDRLLAKLEAGAPPAPSRSSPVAAHSWQDEHLLGFVAECEEPEPAGAPPSPRESAGVMEILRIGAIKQRRAAERALDYYSRSLALRPDSYWGHYRAAGMCNGLGRTAEAAGHLAQCLQRRPHNPVLMGQLAGCLVALGRHREALPLCDQALERAPDHGEFHRTRAFIRTKLGLTGGLDEDLGQLDTWRRTADPPGSPQYRDRLFLEEWPLDLWSAPHETRDQAGEIAPQDIEIYLQLADAIQHAGDFDAAQAVLDKLLKHNPDDFRTRMKRAEYAIRERRFDWARSELDAIQNHPDLLEQLRELPTSGFIPFYMVTHRYLQVEKPEEARKVAERARDLAIQLRRDVGKSHYNLAQVYAKLGRLNDPFIKQAAEQLAQAFAEAAYFRQWYRDDRWWLSPVRTRLDAALRQFEDHTGAGGRLESALPTPR